MLDYKILDYKSKINKNNDTYIDLMSDSFNMSSVAFDGQVIIVNKYYVARPDLVSLAIYGTDDYADIICKINGISNPFPLYVSKGLSPINSTICFATSLR